MKLRAGLVGLGAMGRHHARLLQSIESFEFVGAVDPAGDRYGVLTGSPLFSTVEELVAEGLDAAVVAVPTVAHEEAATVLADAGVHTLIEKPVAASLEAAQRIVERFEKNGVIGAVGHVERFNPALVEMRRRLRRGDLGDLFTISTERVGPFPNRISDVGVVKDLATHDIDLTTWLMEADVVHVAAVTAHKMGREHEDLVAANGRLSNGNPFSLNVNWVTPTKRRSVTVLGERGAFVANLLTADLYQYQNSDVTTEWDALARLTGISEGDVIRFSIPRPEPIKEELEAFGRLVSGDAESEIASLVSGVTTLRVAEAIIRSAENSTVETP